MSDRRSTFPLPLSSVTGGVERRQATPAPVATPQTATRNAAHTAVKGGAALQPQAPLPSPRAPGYAQSHTPSAPSVQRSDMMASEAVRRAMVARVARQGVKDGVVLGAMEAVPRHLFIEPALSAQAYIDASLPIGHNQTISQPYIVARMIEAMKASIPAGGQLGRVLEIGTGCGYQAAVLSFVAREVYSIERIKPLHELAKNNLRPLRISNLRLQYGDGMLGLPQVAPFDGIILAAAGLEVPRALLEQLAIGAHLVAPVGAQVQHLQRITRTGKSEWASETLEACHFVPLRPGTV
ncbi:protein-L-isoaspartate(D-aspartate) O-methyltransferase [Massilia yuzhufengensis]|uniref:Protein-L-isoaspartate O-methyltransferase n=1 Tax=Massilia yuzhufengensis TaxID=1164594 RepID=A0A1I1HBJ4_9BURK|nr:protein-L-isoaspartate(D-aspartate) O-methyltransferase [Massilia yuzhufengensis]SFC21156.1 protein-L-isoaspartate(D-aspartate) O-methyltransferase [Massilia yuzhufengensis]